MPVNQPGQAFNSLVNEYGFTKALTGIGAGVVVGLATTLVIYNVMPSHPRLPITPTVVETVQTVAENIIEKENV